MTLRHKACYIIYDKKVWSTVLAYDQVEPFIQDQDISKKDLPCHMMYQNSNVLNCVIVTVICGLFCKSTKDDADSWHSCRIRDLYDTIHQWYWTVTYSQHCSPSNGLIQGREFKPGEISGVCWDWETMLGRWWREKLQRETAMSH